VVSGSVTHYFDYCTTGLARRRGGEAERQRGGEAERRRGGQRETEVTDGKRYIHLYVGYVPIYVLFYYVHRIQITMHIRYKYAHCI